MAEPEKTFKEILGERINERRAIKNLSTRQFALLAEIEHHQLINIEKGRVDIRLSTLMKIAKTLDTSAKELLDF
ncbi:DNA-binding transcriptional regulator, XRE-family HTH domain [Mucilaginibacter pineti]|uniref:DNA-binding transcriptional regulator, XRE-family HTH domain n=1 Tax=Mucilaginibacter pineti TaxID=1391627 RepID=A0A1G7JPW0_9SPHI|nr:helix-turn-helix transcriptional regulator [Mucilaginibacter pineti]SDF26509.1 DNA-binding transcriptional regulator, XRE-family HTH domain [Mucilaginibacter pineti]